MKTSETIRSATLKCFLHLKSLSASEKTEVDELINKAIEMIDIYPIDKLSRWLGYAQSIYVLQGFTTVNEERDFSRVLFHEAYLNENIKIPESFGINTNIV